MVFRNGESEVVDDVEILGTDRQRSFNKNRKNKTVASKFSKLLDDIDL